MTDQTQNTGPVATAEKPIEITHMVTRGDTTKRFIVNGKPADRVITVTAGG